MGVDPLGNVHADAPAPELELDVALAPPFELLLDAEPELPDALEAEPP